MCAWVGISLFSFSFSFYFILTFCLFVTRMRDVEMLGWVAGCGLGISGPGRME